MDLALGALATKEAMEDLEDATRGQGLAAGVAAAVYTATKAGT